ncbi:hypothetical protein GGD63_005180 [Bradyrhizobium sp. cir1]|uniref:hypothetical protein n=1 Tax=Bradyrhizobium sp. cir1 TaxID=1445730 RepID=UPI0017D498C4|nr:hypothetical protein [Bradyrhizobium sp. cir1]MBB4372372.1 hypothetical protein [Bradyrhizobium sp. cir1]
MKTIRRTDGAASRHLIRGSRASMTRMLFVTAPGKFCKALPQLAHAPPLRNSIDIAHSVKLRLVARQNP